MPGKRKTISKEIWEAVRFDAETIGLSYQELADKWEMNIGSIRAKASRHGWVMPHMIMRKAEELRAQGEIPSEEDDLAAVQQKAEIKAKSAAKSLESRRASHSKIIGQIARQSLKQAKKTGVKIRTARDLQIIADVERKNLGMDKPEEEKAPTLIAVNVNGGRKGGTSFGSVTIDGEAEEVG